MEPDNQEARDVDAHYASNGGVEDRILAAIAATGKNTDRLTIEDLAPFDHFHTGGIAASRALATLANMSSGERVVDVGGGLGGPARMLANEFGARVTVIDLTEEFINVGSNLTERTGLSDLVTFRHGDATAMPFPDGSFDVAWTQHATMNISAKDRLYSEIVRVLRPGGRLVFHEIMSGPNGPIHYPLPWARDASISFVRSPDEVRALLHNVGLVETLWRDTTQNSLDVFRAMREQAAAAQATGSVPPSREIIFGPDFGERVASMGRNYAEGRIISVMAVFTKP